MAHGDSVNITSDEIYYHLCSICEENDTKSEALFCCKNCTKLLCFPCKELHGKLYKTHDVLDKGKVDQWSVPLAPTTDTCEIHTGTRLDLFCQDHDDLCCYICVSTNHR